MNDFTRMTDFFGSVIESTSSSAGDKIRLSRLCKVRARTAVGGQTKHRLLGGLIFNFYLQAIEFADEPSLIHLLVRWFDCLRLPIV
jgi:hypothetical protein